MIGRFLWWPLPDSNWGHTELQSDALPTELKSHVPEGNSVYFTRVTDVCQGYYFLRSELTVSVRSAGKTNSVF